MNGNDVLKKKIRAAVTVVRAVKCGAKEMVCLLHIRLSVVLWQWSVADRGR